MYAGNNHMLNNIRGAINELSVEQINNGLPDGWQLSTLTKTIIEEVIELTGVSEVMQSCQFNNFFGSPCHLPSHKNCSLEISFDSLGSLIF